MKLKFNLEEAKLKAADYLPKLHCGPTVLKVMWEAYGWENEDLLWAGTAFRGGIAGIQEGPCGAVSCMALVTGLRHRTAAKNKAEAERADKAVYEETSALVKSFKEKYGAIDCLKLVGVDFNDKDAVDKLKKTGTLAQNCLPQVLYAIELLYGMEARR
jgi:C_GCAxxG_C_C family probable redox protein